MSDLENKLYTVKYTPDSVSHLKPVQEDCQKCESKICTIICPAGVYEWDEESQKMIVNYENCLNVALAVLLAKIVLSAGNTQKGIKV